MAEKKMRKIGRGDFPPFLFVSPGTMVAGTLEAVRRNEKEKNLRYYEIKLSSDAQGTRLEGKGKNAKEVPGTLHKAGEVVTLHGCAILDRNMNRMSNALHGKEETDGDGNVLEADDASFTTLKGVYVEIVRREDAVKQRGKGKGNAMRAYDITFDETFKPAKK